MGNGCRVLLLVNIWRPTGGLESANRDVASACHALGYDTTVYSVFGRDDESGPFPYRVVSLAPSIRCAGVLWRKLLWLPVVATRVRRHLKNGGILIYGHAHLLPLIHRVPRCRGIRQLGWIYGLEVWGDAARRWCPALNALDDVVSISRFTAGQVQEAGLREAPQIIPCCVDVKTFKPTASPGRIRRHEVLICGRMDYSVRDKGHEILFRSIPVAERYLGQKITVRVVGAGRDKERLEARVRELGVEDRVAFAGRLSREDLIEAYQHCGVFCMPSGLDRRSEGFWNGEGFGIVYVEAAACGRPVIASTEGGAPETILPGKTGLLANPRSVEAVGRAISDILVDPERADAMGRAGRRLSEDRFSRNRFVGLVERLLKGDKAAAASYTRTE